MTTRPQIAVVAAGAMGSAVASRLTQAGCTVLTNLDGRSDATRKRAREAGMLDVPLAEIARRADIMLSIVPPDKAVSFVARFLAESGWAAGAGEQGAPLVFADCNAVNPQTVGRMAALFAAHPARVGFVDAAIIGGPPAEGYDPTIYAAARAEDGEFLARFAALEEWGLKVVPLRDEGARLGDASALKMSYSGITKGITGLFAAMILSAHAASPATANALLHELHASQGALLRRITTAVPPMLPKAYRWAGEMEEVAGFVGGPEGDTYRGLAALYERVARSVDGGDGGGDVAVLRKFVEDAKRTVG